MTIIDLDWNKDSESYGSGRGEVSVKREDYHGCNLFFKIIHTPKTYSKVTFLRFNSSKHILNKSKFHFADATPLNSVEVYFSTLQPEVPLILGIIAGISRYYQLSKLKYSLGNILDSWFPFDQLTETLISENDKLNGFITYRLEVKDDNKSYGNNTINVSFRSFTNYIHYTHKPLGQSQSKKPIFLYNNNLLTLESIYFIQEGKKLVNTQDKKYSSIIVYFYKSSDEQHKVTPKVPILLESDELPGKKNIFRRVDNEGLRWSQVDLTIDDLDDESKRISIINILDHYCKKSLTILINKNQNDDYNVKLANNSDNATIELSGIELPNITVKKGSDLSDRKYTCLYHDLSQCVGFEFYDVSGFKLFITGENNSSAKNNDIEIKLYDNRASKRQHLDFNLSKPEGDNVYKLYVYFYDGDNVPLLVHFGSKFYGPRNKCEYFYRWVEDPDLKDVKPDDTHISDKLSNKLNVINKELNEILLDNSNVNVYGLNNGDRTLENFNLTRVTVEENVTQFYREITHFTTNKGTIGKLMFKGSELQNNEGTKLSECLESEKSTWLNTVSTSTFNGVRAYYHKSDSGYERPLLLGIVRSDTSIAELFFERIDNTYISRWKKIDDSRTLKDKSDLLNKINNLRYRTGKSIKILLSKQDIGYQSCLIENTYESSPIICYFKIDLSTDLIYNGNSSFICFTHKVPEFSKSSNSTDVAGIRLFMSDIEINTFTSDGSRPSPIYYEPGNNEVKVYFYYHISNADTMDFVPLLVGYNNLLYKPSSNDQYFNKWVLVPEIAGEPDIYLKSKLDEINKELNEINISHTDNIGYGLPKERVKCSNSEFCKRIDVDHDRSISHFLKVTHTTFNKGPFRNIYFNNLRIISIDIYSLETFNQVSVYYDTNDASYQKPLLIEIRSENSHSFVKWYSRIGVGTTDWKIEDDSPNYQSDVQIKQKLETIKGTISNFLNISIENQGIYFANVSGGDKKIYKCKMNVGRVFGLSDYKADKYRHYRHNLYDCYTSTNQLKSNLNFDQFDPGIEIKIFIGNDEITLEDLKHHQLTQFLTYGSTTTQELYVYFYEATGYGSDSDDTIPLMFTYNGLFFAPETKSKYFTRWKQLDISLKGDEGKKNIKTKLDIINSMLNEIDISQTDKYGLTLDTHTNKFDTTRITVTQKTVINGKYKYFSHKTKNKFRIGNIKGLGKCQFDNNHSTKIENENINEVLVLFPKEDENYKDPKLVLLIQNNKFSFTVYGYYDLTKEPEYQSKYEFKQPNAPFHLDNLYSYQDELGVDSTLLEILREIKVTNHNQLIYYEDPPSVTNKDNLEETDHDFTEDSRNFKDWTVLKTLPNKIEKAFADDPAKLGGVSGGVGAIAIGGSGFAIYKYNAIIASAIKVIF